LLSRHLDPYPVGHPRHVMTLDEQIAAVKAVTIDDVKKFYADFYGADHGQIAITGDFDEKQIPSLVDQLFGGWKSKATYVRIPNMSKMDAAPINETINTPDKANAFFFASLPMNLQQQDPDYAAVVLGDYMFGGGFLSSRFPERVRQKEGLSYGASSFFNAPWFDRGGQFSANAIAAPQNIAKVEIAFKEELARVLKDGFTPEELKAAKAGWLQEREVDRASGITGTLRTYLFQNRTFTWDADLEEKVDALTPAQVLAAMRKYIDPSKISIVKAGDFSKK
jgi:zinc protease